MSAIRQLRTFVLPDLLRVARKANTDVDLVGPGSVAVPILTARKEQNAAQIRFPQIDVNFVFVFVVSAADDPVYRCFFPFSRLKPWLPLVPDVSSH